MRYFISKCSLIFFMFNNSCTSATGVLDAFAIKTSGCTIPNFSAHNEILKDITSYVGTYTNCSEVSALLDSNSSHIWIDEESILQQYYYNRDEFYCCYSNFTLKPQFQVVYEECIVFKTVIEIRNEFVRVQCYYFDEKIHDYFHLSPPQASSVDSPGDVVRVTDEFNVLVMGIENMSRLNFRRTMPQTHAELQRMGGIEFYGYNKIGDNTLPNLFPVLSGAAYDYNVDVSQLSSYYKFVWQDFKMNGYKTALGSDSCGGVFGSLEYAQSESPTHYYLLPFFMQANEYLYKRSYYYHKCVGKKYAYKIMLDYIEGLMKAETAKKFGLFWEESVTHEHLNMARIMDRDYAQFLRNMRDTGILDNTVLLFISDHGMRWGQIQMTIQGQHEGLLPLFNVVIPRKFRNKYPIAFKNLKKNSRRLVTPFDIHKTLCDLANLSTIHDEVVRGRQKEAECEIYHSIFLKVSKKRTCSDVGISEHWCACYRPRFPVGKKEKKIAAHHLMMHLNDSIKRYPQCSVLSIDKILDVKMSESSELPKTYNVVLTTNPGGGIFDGTLITENEKWSVSGMITRLNLYGNQSYCVSDPLIKNYCFCL